MSELVEDPKDVNDVSSLIVLGIEPVRELEERYIYLSDLSTLMLSGIEPVRELEERLIY